MGCISKILSLFPCMRGDGEAIHREGGRRKYRQTTRQEFSGEDKQLCLVGRGIVSTACFAKKHYIATTILLFVIGAMIAGGIVAAVNPHAVGSVIRHKFQASVWQVSLTSGVIAVVGVAVGSGGTYIYIKFRKPSLDTFGDIKGGSSYYDITEDQVGGSSQNYLSGSQTSYGS